MIQVPKHWVEVSVNVLVTDLMNSSQKWRIFFTATDEYQIAMDTSTLEVFYVWEKHTCKAWMNPQYCK